MPLEYGKSGKLSLFLDSHGVLRGGDKGGASASAADPPIFTRYNLASAINLRLKIFYLDGLDGFSELESKHFRVEIKLAIECSLDVLSPA